MCSLASMQLMTLTSVKCCRLAAVVEIQMMSSGSPDKKMLMQASKQFVIMMMSCKCCRCAEQDMATQTS